MLVSGTSSEASSATFVATIVRFKHLDIFE